MMITTDGSIAMNPIVGKGLGEMFSNNFLNFFFGGGTPTLIRVGCDERRVTALVSPKSTRCMMGAVTQYCNMMWHHPSRLVDRFLGIARIAPTYGGDHIARRKCRYRKCRYRKCRYKCKCKPLSPPPPPDRPTDRPATGDR